MAGAMHISGKVHEKFFTEIWKSQNFSELFTREGKKIDIIDPGIENNDLGGPDFRNARIKINSITYIGDVEIDSFHSDWKNHGHHFNKKYNSVILHIVLSKDNYPFVETQDGRKVPSLSIQKFLNKELSLHIQDSIKSEHSNKDKKVKCYDMCLDIPKEEKLDFITQLGVERLKHKTLRNLERLKEIIYFNEMKTKEPMIRYSLDQKFYDREFTVKDFVNNDAWNQLLYEMIFEALGYSKNKDIMLKMAKEIPLEYFSGYKDENRFINKLESILFNVSGLIPNASAKFDETTIEYIRHLAEDWANLKNKYDGKLFNETDWNFMGLRPHNFPTVRLAGGARYIKMILRDGLFNKVATAFKFTTDERKIIQTLKDLLLIRGDNFWKHHLVFGSKIENPLIYLVGSNRIDELLSNVILPLYSLYFQIFSKDEYNKRVINVYIKSYQKADNYLITELSESLGIEEAKSKSVLYQGLLELFRNYCSKDKCTDCLIGQKIFTN